MKPSPSAPPAISATKRFFITRGSYGRGYDKNLLSIDTYNEDSMSQIELVIDDEEIDEIINRLSEYREKLRSGEL